MVDPKRFYRCGESQMALEKYETRISKFETNHKFECPNFQNGQNKPIKAVITRLRIGSEFIFVIYIYVISAGGGFRVSCFVFRVACFGFRIYNWR